MSGLTNHYNLPYPTSGDPMYLGAAQMQAAMEGVDAALWAAGVPIVAQQEPPSASLLVATGGVSITSGTITPITWASADYDVFPPASSAAFASGRWNCRVAGIHQIEVSWPWLTSGTGNRSMYLYKNGTATGNIIDVDGGRVANGLDITNRISCQIKLIAGDWLTVGVYQNSGGTQLAGQNSYGGMRGRFSATWLRQP
jgi:hypothetical protein